MQYTDDQKAEALRLYGEIGAAATAHRLDIPPRTIRYWANQAHLATARTQNLESAAAMLAASHRRMREEFRLRLLEKGLDALDRMDQEHIDYRGKEVYKVSWEVAPADAFKSYAVAAAVLIDKYRLEMGEATTRTEEVASHDIDRSVAQLVAELARRGEAPTPPGVVDRAFPAGPATP